MSLRIDPREAYFRLFAAALAQASFAANSKHVVEMAADRASIAVAHLQSRGIVAKEPAQ